MGAGLTRPRRFSSRGTAAHERGPADLSYKFDVGVHAGQQQHPEWAITSSIAL